MKLLPLILIATVLFTGCLEQKSKKEAQQETYFYGEVYADSFPVSIPKDRILDGYAIEWAYWVQANKELPHGVFVGNGFEFHDAETDSYLPVVGYVSINPKEVIIEDYRNQVERAKYYGAASYGEAKVLFLALNTPEGNG